MQRVFIHMLNASVKYDSLAPEHDSLSKSEIKNVALFLLVLQ